MVISGKKSITKYVRTGLLLLVALACMMAFVLVQPFGDGPDEMDRYKVVQYIVNHGTLPVGDDPEVLIEGYGGSYAYQPILTYMIQGYLLRTLSFLNLTFDMQLIIARCVCVIMGLVAAVYTLKIAKELFEDDRMRSLFSLAVVLLPQNLFIYTYVNTDSMGLMSIVIIIYALLRGKRTDYDRITLINLSIGCILCLMSYYNCYGACLVAAIVCLVDRPSDCLKKALKVVTAVVLGSGWWFVRNAILYQGDILALNARRVSMATTGIAEVSPAANTCRDMGMSLYDMVFGTEYFVFVWQSFIGKFGPMLIPTNHYVYMSHKYLFLLSIAGLIMLWRKEGLTTNGTVKERITRDIWMLALVFIPSALALYYSYTWDYQPQGRYYLPIVIPLMYYCTIGLSRLIGLCSDIAGKIVSGADKIALMAAYHVLYIYLYGAALISVFYMMLKHYGVY